MLATITGRMNILVVVIALVVDTVSCCDDDRGYSLVCRFCHFRCRGRRMFVWL